MSRPQRVIHAAILCILGTGFLAALYMVFVVYHVEGHSGPLMGGAADIPHDFLVERRLYALEAWLTFGFLSVYLALTWLRPSRRGDERATAPREDTHAR